ncbi:hypothetical protein [Ulvibacter litoralis]|uniref:Type II secretion system protein GspG C-terminal domain-containing protein n=2 Tax=Ulvibacter litoralis TaxID=227084 RepID=A0A1G7JP50_9FLAO|nr:hypothetical protein [Ulvibacter litoralis]SDF26732.1 hypothetical protein SAMN05421855_1215 [Ulvibacter litoralis]
MNNLIPFIASFFLPGIGQFVLKDFKKGSIIFLSNIILTFILISTDFLSFIPNWTPHIVLMIWALFDVYDKIEHRDGKKSATRYMAFSLLIVVVLLPITLTLLITGIFKGVEFLSDEYLNEDRTKTEMNKISTELGLYKNHYRVYPKNYDSFIGQKPIWGSWKADSWKNPYKYELIDSLNYKLISAGKDGIYFNEDDIIRSN